jgi:probable F420-dependent oxidoreductase
VDDVLRWGLSIPARGVPLDEHPEMFRQIEALGYTDVWSVEGGVFDAFTPLALAASTSSLRLGAGVVSTFTRGPALLANTAAAMAAAAPGRFVLGIGSSTSAIVERWNGIPFDRPFQRTVDVLRFLRAAFTGERVDGEFATFTTRGFRQAVPDVRPQIVVAALRERMLRLAGQEADGAMLNWVSAEDAGRLAGIVRSENPRTQIIDRIIVCPSEDQGAVYAVAKPMIASYLSVGEYRKFYEWLGHGDELSSMWNAWDAGDRAGAASAVPDPIANALCIHGSRSECLSQIGRFFDMGVTTAVLFVMPHAGLNIRDAIEAVAPERSHANQKQL